MDFKNMNPYLLENIKKTFVELFGLPESYEPKVLASMYGRLEHRSSYDLVFEVGPERFCTVYYDGEHGWTRLGVTDGESMYYDERFVRRGLRGEVAPWDYEDVVHMLEKDGYIECTSGIPDESEIMEAFETFMDTLGLHNDAEYEEAKYTCPCCGEDLRNQSYHCCDSSNFI